MHYYQFNIADYRKDTQHLTPLEHYIYRSLIDWYYLDEKPIPLETQVVARRLSLGTDMVSLLENVLSDFFKKQENGYHHLRIDSEIVAYHEMAEKNKVNGKLGGRPRKTQSVSFGNPNKPTGNPNQEPLTNNQEPLNTKALSESSDSDEYSKYPDFLTFWLAYPDKTGKGDALKAWKKSKPNINKVIEALSWQKTSKKWQEGFVPNPATYLNQKRYDDEPKESDRPMLAGML